MVQGVNYDNTDDDWYLGKPDDDDYSPETADDVVVDEWVVKEDVDDGKPDGKRIDAWADFLAPGGVTFTKDGKGDGISVSTDGLKAFANYLDEVKESLLKTDPMLKEMEIKAGAFWSAHELVRRLDEGDPEVLVVVALVSVGSGELPGNISSRSVRRLVRWPSICGGWPVSMMRRRNSTRRLLRRSRSTLRAVCPSSTRLPVVPMRL